MLTIRYSNKFQKNLELMIRRGKDPDTYHEIDTDLLDEARLVSSIKSKKDRGFEAIASVPALALC